MCSFKVTNVALYSKRTHAHRNYHGYCSLEALARILEGRDKQEIFALKRLFNDRRKKEAFYI